MIEPEILEAIEKSEPRPEIVAALNDDLITAGIVTPEDPNAFVGSRLYNVSSAALNIRRAEPNAGGAPAEAARGWLYHPDPV